MSKDIVKNLIKEFDFDRVHTVMETLDWRWGDSGDVPTIVELVVQAQELIEESLKEDHYRVGTGGFYVTNQDDEITLSFELTSAFAIKPESEPNNE